MAKLKGGSRIYGNVTVDTSVLAATVNASTVNASSFILANGVDLVTLAQTGGSTSNDAYAQANAAYGQANSARNQANTARNTANDAYAAANTKVGSSGDQTITGNVTISGNLVVQGNATTINVSNLSVNDAIILLSANATGDAADIGFVGHFDRGVTGTHAGMVRIHTLNEFQIFDNYELEPTNNIIDIANYNYRLGNLRVNTINANSVLILGNAAATQANLTLSHNQANSAYGQANAAYSQANAAYTQANSAYDQANAAYGQANSARSDANTTFATINTTFGTVNTSLGSINTSLATINTNYQAAYSLANSNYLPAVTRLVVTANGSSAYRFDQYGATTDDPSIYIRAGETIAFNLTMGNHPFVIRVSNGGANYDTGLTHVATDGTVTTGSSAQAKTSGTLYWKVPSELAGNTYVYQCTLHSGMVGNIVIEPNSTVIYAQANAAYGQANAAYTQANSARSDANTTFATINTTFGTINTNATNINSNAINAYGQANTARSDANTTFATINTTFSTVNTTFGTINTTFGTVNTTFGTTNTSISNKMATAGGTFTGDVNFKRWTEITTTDTNVTTSKTVDLSVGSYFVYTMTGSTTFTFNNAIASGNAHSFTIVLKQDAGGSRAPSWSANIKFAGGAAPPYTANASAVDIWSFTTYDGGTTYVGTLAVKDAR